MSSAVLLARLALVVIFTTAGVAKLNDLQASRDTVEAFGFPRAFARYVGTGLPFAELTVAVALLVTATARWAGVAALLLLVAFSIGVAYALSQGRTPDCNCFGQVSSEEIGIHTLIRNGVLIVVAAFVIWKAPGSAVTSWTRDVSASNLVSALSATTAVLLAITVYQYRKRAFGENSDSRAEAPDHAGLALGSVAPDFELTDLNGKLIQRDDLLAAGLPVVMIFASPTCGPCQALMPELGRWHAAMNESITFVVVESGTHNPNVLEQTLSSAGDVLVLVEDGYDVAHQFGATATPTGIALNHDGTLASRPHPGQGQIEKLVRIVLSATQQHGSAAEPAAVTQP